MTAEPDALAARMDQIRRRLSMRNYTDSAALLAAVEAVLRDHGPRTRIPPNRHYAICRACSRIWPCATVQDITKELLAAARAELEKRHLAHIREANAAFMRDPTNREGVIQPAWHHVSAHALKKSKAECPWLGESLAPAGREECPGCGTPYNVGILKCRDCNYILDKSRYDKAVKEGLFAA